MRHDLLEICLSDLFTDISQLREKYPEDTVLSVLRLRDMYLWLNARPSSRDADFIKEEVTRYHVSRPTAYSDLNILKTLLPGLSKKTKDFHMWQFLEMIRETYNIARAKKDVRTMERAAASFAKYTGLDKEEEQHLPLDQIIVQPFIPVDDPSVLGITPIPNRREYVRQIIQKYSRDVPDIMDIEAEEHDLLPDIPDPDSHTL